jgi:hypothetical protein
VAALALVESVAAVLGPRGAPQATEWIAAGQRVRAGFRAGDLIVFAPPFIDQLGRLYLGDLIDVEMAGRPDADRYPRIWEVAFQGARAEEAAGARRIETSRHGPLAVTLYEKDAVEVLFDVTRNAEKARVTQRPGDGRGDETPCPTDRGGFRCASTRVAPRTLEIDYRPRRGLLVPLDGRLTTSVELDEVPLGRRLVGYTGLHDYYARKSADGAVDFVVLVDGKERLRLRHANQDGWRRFEIDTSAEAGQRKTLRFEISGPDARWRNFGFHAESRK